MNPSESEPGPWVQASSVTKNSPSRLKTASTRPALSTLSALPGATSAVLHRSMRIAACMHVLLADGRQRTSLCRAGADPIRDHAVHRLVIGVPRFLLSPWICTLSHTLFTQYGSVRVKASTA